MQRAPFALGCDGFFEAQAHMLKRPLEGILRYRQGNRYRQSTEFFQADHRQKQSKIKTLYF